MPPATTQTKIVGKDRPATRPKPMRYRATPEDLEEYPLWGQRIELPDKLIVEKKKGLFVEDALTSTGRVRTIRKQPAFEFRPVQQLEQESLPAQPLTFYHVIDKIRRENAERIRRYANIDNRGDNRGSGFFSHPHWD